MAMQPAIGHQNGRGIWIYNQLPCHRISDFFEGSNRGVQLIAGPGTQYSFPYLRERLGYVRNLDVPYLSVTTSYVVTT